MNELCVELFPSFRGKLLLVFDSWTALPNLGTILFDSIFFVGRRIAWHYDHTSDFELSSDVGHSLSMVSRRVGTQNLLLRIVQLQNLIGRPSDLE